MELCMHKLQWEVLRRSGGDGSHIESHIRSHMGGQFLQFSQWSLVREQLEDFQIRLPVNAAFEALENK